MRAGRVVTEGMSQLPRPLDPDTEEKCHPMDTVTGTLAGLRWNSWRSRDAFSRACLQCYNAMGMGGGDPNRVPRIRLISRSRVSVAATELNRKRSACLTRLAD